MGLDKFRTSFGFWQFPLTVLAVSMVVALLGDEGRELLRYDRIWIAEGETWRLVSGHLTHLGWSHLALNGAGLVLVWFLVGDRFDTLDWWIVVGLSMTAIDLGLWFLNGNLIWYVGLSGVLHGVLAAGILAGLRGADAESVVLAVLLLAKLGWEQLSGPMPGSTLSAGGPVIVDAHLYGTGGGLLGALLTRVRVGNDATI